MFSLKELVERLGGECVGDDSIQIRRITTLEQAEKGDLSFLSNPKYVGKFRASKASAFIVASSVQHLLAGRSGILVEDPYLYYARVAHLFKPHVEVVPGVHLTAAVFSLVPRTVTVEAGATVEIDVQLGEHVVIGAGSYVGKGSRIGAGTWLAPRATVYANSVIGERCLIHSGAVIGSDGFGFARQKDGSWFKIPQMGRVVIGNDVEVGANTTIDRGALDDTVIADGVKLDNLVQIAHNVHVGKNTAIAGCVGIAGSTTIGARCMIGGQAGIIGHLTIADDVVISAGTLVTKSIHKPGVYTATLPVQTHSEWMKNFSYLRHLDALADRVRAIEQHRAGEDLT